MCLDCTRRSVGAAPVWKQEQQGVLSWKSHLQRFVCLGIKPHRAQTLFLSSLCVDCTSCMYVCCALVRHVLLCLRADPVLRAQLSALGQDSLGFPAEEAVWDGEELRCQCSSDDWDPIRAFNITYIFEMLFAMCCQRGRVVGSSAHRFHVTHRL